MQKNLFFVFLEIYHYPWNVYLQEIQNFFPSKEFLIQPIIEVRLNYAIIEIRLYRPIIKVLLYCPCSN